MNDLTLGTLDFDIANNAFAFPNPIQSNCTLTYHLVKDERLTLTLVDLQGAIVHQYFKNEIRFAGTHREEVILDEELRPGIYFLNLSNEHGATTIKIVKQD